MSASDDSQASHPFADSVDHPSELDKGPIGGADHHPGIDSSSDRVDRLSDQVDDPFDDPLTDQSTSTPKSIPELSKPDTPDRERKGYSTEPKSTPTKMKTASLVGADHDRDDVFPLVRGDLNTQKQYLSTQKWVEGVTRTQWADIAQWQETISGTNFAHDPIIVQAVQSYCSARKETDLYQPWCRMANRILELARQRIPNLPPYLVDDIKYYRNDPTIIRGSDAKRKPDVTLMRQSTFEELWGKTEAEPKRPDRRNPRTRDISWFDVLSVAEFKAPNVWKDFRGLIKPWNEFLEKTGFEGSLVQLTGYGRGQGNEDAEDFPIEPIAELLRPSGHAASAPPTLGRDPQAIDDIKNTDDLPATRKRKSKTVRDSAIKRQRNTEGEAVNKHPTNNHDNYKKDPSEEQLASYSLEMLATTRGTRLHTITMLIYGSEVEFWYTDASGFVVSKERICWIKDFNRFAAILVAINCCNAEQMGFRMPRVIYPDRNDGSEVSVFPPRSLTGATLSMPGHREYGDITIRFGEHVFSQYSLVGRRTIVYEITFISSTLGVTDEFVVKMSFQYVTRHIEPEFLIRAEKSGVKHLPVMFWWTCKEAGSEWRTSDGVRGLFFPDNSGDRFYEERTFVCIIFKKYMPLENVLNRYNFGSVFGQLLDCLHDLRYKARLLHRDVSFSNLMYEMQGDVVYLILNDFDLAMEVDENGNPIHKTSSHRTGTLPFMAIDILMRSQQTHYLRHDMESAFYVAFWCAVKLPRVVEGDPKATHQREAYLKEWEEGDLLDMAARKTIFLASDTYISIKAPVSEEFADYAPWFGQVRRVIRHAIHAESDWKCTHRRSVDGFDFQTLDGRFTYEIIRDAMRMGMEEVAETIDGLIMY